MAATLSPTDFLARCYAVSDAMRALASCRADLIESRRRTLRTAVDELVSARLVRPTVVMTERQRDLLRRSSIALADSFERMMEAA